MPNLSRDVEPEEEEVVAHAHTISRVTQAPAEKLRSKIALGVKTLLHRSESRRYSSPDVTEATSMPVTSYSSSERSAPSFSDVTSAEWDLTSTAQMQDTGYTTYMDSVDPYESLWMTSASALPPNLISHPHLATSSTDAFNAQPITARPFAAEDDKIRRLIGEMRRSRVSPVDDVDDRESGVIFVAGRRHVVVELPVGC